MKFRNTRTASLLLQIAICATVVGCLDSSESPEENVSPPPTPPPTGNSAPTISGSPQTSVTIAEQYSFAPVASDPDGDTLSFTVSGQPSWASFNTNTGVLSGTPTMGDIGTYGDILISVSDGTATASLPQFSVAVNQVSTGSVTLSWTPPTQNEDGSSLNDLMAYKIYYGLSQGNYPNQIRVDTAGISSYVVDNLSPNTYYFVATAINSAEVESGFSNVATKTVN